MEPILLLYFLYNVKLCKERINERASQNNLYFNYKIRINEAVHLNAQHAPGRVNINICYDLTGMINYNIIKHNL